MSTLLRVWAVTAAVLAALLLMRGAWLAALVMLLLSPAPVLAFAPGPSDPLRLSLSWIGAVVLAAIALLALLLVIVSFGGLPQVHEWRALLRG